MKVRALALLGVLIAPLSASALPDLTVTSVSATPTSVGAGGTLAITSTVKSSNGAATSFVVKFYLSTDATITSADTLVGSRTVSSLASGASSTATTNVTLPVNLTGSFYVGAIVDANNQVAESNETNNAKAGTQITITKPDLTVTALSATPTTVAAGGSLVVSDTVKVTGGAAGPFVVRYYLSTSTTISTGNTQLGSRSIGSLASGASSAGQVTVTVPTSVNAGTYYVGAIVDADGQVAESNETNNTKAGTQITVTKPDLTVVSVAAAPAAVAPGGQLTITDSVQSTGGSAGPFVVRFYLSTDSTITSADTAIGSRSVSSLSSGTTSSGSTLVTLPTGIASGTYYVGAIVDADGQVAESNEANNAKAGNQVTISLPDLTVAALNATPVTLASGGQLSISDTVQASGGPVPAFVVRYYLSTTASITTAGTPLGSRTVNGLAAGGSSSATTLVTIPAGLGGKFYVGAIVDADNQVAEANESNNALAGPQITISPPCIGFSYDGAGNLLSVSACH